MEQLWGREGSLPNRSRLLGRQWEDRAHPSRPSSALSAPLWEDKCEEFSARKCSKRDQVKKQALILKLMYISHYFWACMCLSRRCEGGIFFHSVPEDTGHEIQGSW